MKFVFAFVAAFLAFVSASVYNLGDNFNQVTSSGVWFVKFYAPWCGHCKKLAPVWDQLATKVESENIPINIAHVDCTQSKNVCSAHDIKGYPTLLPFVNGAAGAKYAKARTLDSLVDFAKQISAGHSKVVPSTEALGSTGSSTASFFAQLSGFPTSNPKVNLFLCLGAIASFVIIAGVVSGKSAGKKSKVAKRK